MTSRCVPPHILLILEVKGTRGTWHSSGLEVKGTGGTPLGLPGPEVKGSGGTSHSLDVEAKGARGTSHPLDMEVQGTRGILTFPSAGGPGNERKPHIP